MTLSELYNELWLDVNSSQSDDSVLDERLLKHFIHKVRAVFVRNELNKSHRTVDASLIQDLGLVELEAVSDFTPSDITNIEHKILRTVQDIPKPLELHTKQAFTYIGSLSQTSKGFKIVDIANMPYVGNGKFNKNFMYAFIMNNKIHIIGNCNNTAFKGLKYINIKGVFENPEDASKFNKPDGTPCYSDNEEYPLPLYMWNYIKNEIIKSDLRQFYVPIEDVLNNANNDINRMNIPVSNEKDKD